MPAFRDLTGCRCRNTLLIITSARFRLLTGLPCRKIEVQTCESVASFQAAERGARMRFNMTPLSILAVRGPGSPSSESGEAPG